MANLINDTMSKASDYKSRIGSPELQLDHMVQSAGERVGAMASQVSDKTTDYIKSGREYVLANPVKGVAIAAATGLVAGSLLSLLYRQKTH
jgi:ElaB/YqjD/DUF883 family membrane-anchored ribosome-binding protein